MQKAAIQKPRRNIAAIIAGPVMAVIVMLLADIPAHPQAPAMLGLVLWMAIWWISECVPLALTSLIPLMLFPLLGIATGKQVAPNYMNNVIFLFLGGFLIAQAMQTSRLHHRIAINMLSRWHAGPLQLAIGFSLATAFLSMWISNTATTMLMVTIALPVLHRILKEQGEKEAGPMVAIFLLVIAYSANIGGVGTPVGSPPNLVFMEIVQQQAPAFAPSFLQWMMLGIPFVAAGLLVLFVVLNGKLRKLPWHSSSAATIASERDALGSMRREEKMVASVLTITALLWMTRKGIPMQDFSIPGWSSLLPYPGVDDGTVAILGAATLFLLRGADSKPILDGTAFGRLPWDIVILFGGGFALAFGMGHSGLSHWIGSQLGFLQGIPLPLMLLAIALAITFLTEVTSNTAITLVMLPILAAAALGNQIDPLLVMLPATIAASCAFMLPVATPPNAIVFGTHHIPMQTMVKNGIRLNLIMAVVLVAIVYFLRPLLPGAM